MNVEDLIKGARQLLGGGALEAPPQPRFPLVAIEIRPDRVIGARLVHDRKNGHHQLQRVESEPLPE